MESGLGLEGEGGSTVEPAFEFFGEGGDLLQFD